MVGVSGVRPKMGIRPDAPTIATIVPVTFYGIVSFYFSTVLPFLSN
jgi:hypothetical protein